MKTDYSKYRFSIKELITGISLSILLCLALNYLFYKNLWLLLIIIPVTPLFLKLMKAGLIKKRRKNLNYDFKELLNALSVAYRAGYSTENAFVEAEKYLNDTIGRENILTREINYINRNVQMNVPIEKLLDDFALRSGIEDIINFSAVFSSAKRMGGNMAVIITSAASQIEGKIDVEREIDTALAAKKYEQRIMSFMPFVIILYMQLTSPDFISCLYGTLLGVITMSGCLLVYAGAFILGSRIVTIEI